MAEFRDFDAARRERLRDREPIRFVVCEQEFETVPVVPAGNIIDLIAGEQSGHPVIAYRRFILAVLRDDDGTDEKASSQERMLELLYRPDDPLDEVTLSELLGWLAETFGGRPTQRSTDSSSGPLPDGQPSKVVSLSKRTVTLPEASSG